MRRGFLYLAMISRVCFELVENINAVYNIPALSPWFMF